MRDISLHLLDLVENAVRAEATVICVTVEANPLTDLFKVTVQDNGPGFAGDPQVLADPFFTTKAGKRVGLGLSMLKAAAERAGGAMTLGRSVLGGARVTASMKLGHLDRSPLGELAETAAAVVCANPDVELRVRLVGPGETFAVSSGELGGGDSDEAFGPASRMSELIRAAASRVWEGVEI